MAGGISWVIMRLALPLSLRAGKIDVYGGSFMKSAVQSNAAAGLFCKPKNLAQAQSGSFARLLGREEGFERLGADFVRHPGAAVRHADHHILAGGRFFRRPRRPKPCVAGADREAADTRHRIPRVDGQVEDGEFELSGISERLRDVAFKLRLDLDAAAQSAL